MILREEEVLEDDLTPELQASGWKQDSYGRLLYSSKHWEEVSYGEGDIYLYETELRALTPEARAYADEMEGTRSP